MRYSITESCVIGKDIDKFGTRWHHVPKITRKMFIAGIKAGEKVSTDCELWV
jgi:hypothetical protein